MPIIWTNDKDMYNKTKECLNKFDNIQAFFDIQNTIYTEYWASKGGMFEVDFDISERVSLGLFYGRTSSIVNAKFGYTFDNTGLSLSVRL